MLYVRIFRYSSQKDDGVLDSIRTRCICQLEGHPERSSAMVTAKLEQNVCCQNRTIMPSCQLSSIAVLLDVMHHKLTKLSETHGRSLFDRLFFPTISDRQWNAFCGRLKWQLISNVLTHGMLVHGYPELLQPACQFPHLELWLLKIGLQCQATWICPGGGLMPASISGCTCVFLEASCNSTACSSATTVLVWWTSAARDLAFFVVIGKTLENSHGSIISSQNFRYPMSGEMTLQAQRNDEMVFVRLSASRNGSQKRRGNFSRQNGKDLHPPLTRAKLRIDI